MTTRKPINSVRVARVFISGLLIASGTGCAWRAGAPAVLPSNGPINATAITAPTQAPLSAPTSAHTSGSTNPSTSGSTDASTSATPSAPPVPRNSASSPASVPTSRQLAQTPSPEGIAGLAQSASALPKVDHRKHAGNYRCDHGRTIRIADVPEQTDVILLTWQGKQHRLERVLSNSGAERFEELATGLVWILIPGKAMLLSTNQGRALANECHL